MDSFEKVKLKAKSLKKEVRALYIASKRPDVPLLAKLLIIIVVGYALSPLDLIPDFIPVLGYLDDLVLIPLGIWLALRMIPVNILDECRMEAQDNLAVGKPVSWTAGIIVIMVWIVVIIAIILKVKT